MRVNNLENGVLDHKPAFPRDLDSIIQTTEELQRRGYLSHVVHVNSVEAELADARRKLRNAMEKFQVS